MLAFSHDRMGNLIRGQDASGVWQRFEYDAAGRLKKVKDDSSNVLETYTYGAGRNKLMVETSSQRRYFAWGGQAVVAEFVEIGSSTTPAYDRSYIYAGSRLLMTFTPTSTGKEAKEYHHPDRLGTQLVTTGASSSFRQTTFPFGTTISAETTGNSNQVFTSYDRSSTTGLDYAVNRTYSKGQGRFTQVDPIAMASASIGNPQSNNLYAYVQNMPTDFVDPSGLDASGSGTSYGGILWTLWYGNNVDGWKLVHSWFEPFPLESLIGAASSIIEEAMKNPKGDCAKLLGSDAVSKFANAKKNISYNEKRFESGRTNGMRVDDSIFLNPRGFAFSNFRLSFTPGGSAEKAAKKVNDQIDKHLGWANSQFEYAVATVIHEFLHLIGKFGPDGNAFDMKESEKNQKKVIDSCLPKKK